ncbi:MAG TPA: ATP-binding protein, partial [Chryseolinea sp.]
LFLLISLLTAQITSAQNVNIQQADSLRRELARATQDTTRAIILADLAEAYRTERPDSTLYFADQTLQLCRDIDFPFGEMRAYLVLCFYFYFTISDTPQALEAGQKALDLAEKNGFKDYEGACLIRVAQVNLQARNPQAAFNYLKRANKLLSNNGDPFFYAVTYWWLATTYLSMNKPDSALHMATIGRDKAIEIKSDRVLGQVLKIMGRIYSNKGDLPLAKQYYLEGIHAAERMNELVDVASGYLSLANIFRGSNQNDSAIYYATKAYEICRPRSIKNIIVSSGNMLSELLASKDPAEALRYLKIANAARDSIYTAQKVQSAQALLFKERERRVEMAFEKKAYQSSVRQYALLAGVGVLLFVVLSLYRNNRNKQVANVALEKQKEKVENTLIELRATQAQLIQSEKMASLGELTAGIAHEIQNPLNFVNNFSEVNRELIAELKSEKSKPKTDRDDQAEDELLNVIEQNLGKINHHGKRADAIVKGMLQHSRATSGQAEPTDINALCDEYVRLAYHGFRAKDKSRSDGQILKPIRVETDFHPSLPKINVVPQDIGRAILNLISNALYAVSQRRAELIRDQPEYEPTVTVSTKKSGDNVLISVKDNGNGIPDSIKDKIFQPFFTTKPVGQGTGLGLSMTYDIVKAHGGTLKADSQVGGGTEFIIQFQNV